MQTDSCGHQLGQTLLLAWHLLEEVQQLASCLAGQHLSWLVIAQPAHSVSGLPPDAPCAVKRDSLNITLDSAPTQQQSQ